MATIGDFYYGEPYLHGAPSYSEKKVDRFVPQPIDLGGVDSDKEYTVARDFLTQAIEKAEQMEQYFYTYFEAFGVKDAKSFSERFLVPTAPEDYFETRAEIMETGTLYRKIHFILNNPHIQDVLFRSKVDRMHAVLKDILKDEVYQYVVSILNNDDLISRYGLAALRSVLSNQKGRGKDNMRSFRYDNTVIELNIPSGGVNLSSAILNKYLMKTAVKQDLSFSQEAVSQAIYALAKFQLDSFGYASALAIKIIRDDLNREITVKDIGVLLGETKTNKIDSKIKMNRKREIIRYVMDRVKNFLADEQNHKKASLYHVDYYATGRLLEFGLEVTLNSAFIANWGLGAEQIARDVSDAVIFSPNFSLSREAPSDLEIAQHILGQLKSSRTPFSAKGRKVGPSLMKKQDLSGLFVEMQKQGLTDLGAIANLEYNIVNYLHRGEGADLGALVGKIISWAVEIYVKSDTIRSFIEDISDVNYIRTDIGEIALNNFWVVEDKLIPISAFLRAAYNVLSENKEVETWYSSGSGKITSTERISDRTMHRHKMLVKPKGDTGFDPWNSVYDSNVLAVGRKYGTKVLNAAKIGNVYLSNNFVADIYNIMDTLNG